MINVSSIKQHMYCPMKLYIKTHVDTNENDDYHLSIEMKKLKIDIQDLIQKNMRKIRKEMTIPEIEGILSENIDSYIESTADAIESMNLGLEKSQTEEIKSNAYFLIKTTALKLKQIMMIHDKHAYAVMDMFFPTSLYSILLKDKSLDIIGVCDKAEIIDGKYYPVLLKSGRPPIKGVWDQDAIELAAYAILLEEEFESEVFVGFVDYEKIADRRPVVMDVNIRKGLFEIIREVKEIVENKKLPNVKKSTRKCEKCEYREMCMN